MELISALLFFTLFTSTTKAFHSCSRSSSDLSIIPFYGKCSPFTPPKPDSWVNTVIDMASKDRERISYLYSLVAQKTTKVPIASGQKVLNIGNYVLRVKLGTPGQLMYMVLDTSSDAAWVPCSGCVGCSSTTFSSSDSSTFGATECSMPECTQVRGLSCPETGIGSCRFNRSYGGSSFAATLSRDSLTLATNVISNFTFGCINAVSGGAVPPQGLLGLGRGSMSLLSQTGSLYSGVFSYCLPSFKSDYFSGSLILGPSGQPKNIKTTPLLKSPHRPSLYYVNLTGISVGRVLVPVAPAFDPNIGAGTIIDSGTVITRFVEPVYAAIRDEFRKQVKGPFSSLGAFDTCFPASNEASSPVITFHFTEMDLKFPLENSLIHSTSEKLVCLTMAPTPKNVNSVLNIIANLQQQNMRVMFDVANSRLGIARQHCI